MTAVHFALIFLSIVEKLLFFGCVAGFIYCLWILLNKKTTTKVLNTIIHTVVVCLILFSIGIVTYKLKDLISNKFSVELIKYVHNYSIYKVTKVGLLNELQGIKLSFNKRALVAYFDSAETYACEGKYLKAVEYYQKSIDIYPTIASNTNTAIYLIKGAEHKEWTDHAGKTYYSYDAKLLDQNSSYLFLALKLAKSKNNKIMRRICFYNLGLVSLSYSDYKVAIDFFNESYKYQSKVGSIMDVQNLLVNIGDACNGYVSTSNDFTLGIVLYNDLLYKCKMLNLLKLAAQSYFNLGISHYYIEDYKQSERFLNEALCSYRYMGLYKEQVKVLNMLSVVYNIQGDAYKALNAHGLSMHLNDRYFGEKTLRVNNTIRINNLIKWAAFAFLNIFAIIATNLFFHNIPLNFKSLLVVVLIVLLNISCYILWESISNPIKDTIILKHDNIFHNDSQYYVEVDIGWTAKNDGFSLFCSGGQLFHLEPLRKAKDLFDEKEFIVDATEGYPLISMNIFDSKGQLIAWVFENEVTPFKDNIADYNYTNDTVEIVNKMNNVVLQLKVNKDQIKINGIFYNLKGERVAIIPPKSEKDSTIIVEVVNKAIPEPKIPKMFKYPSRSHLGELNIQ